MVSRSADAELNALVLEKLGFEAVRGSGGRDSRKSASNKGGAKALIALKKSLDAGNNVAMIADIPHGTPRQAGLGIVTLARISGRPILPVAHRHQPPQGAGEKLGQDHDQPAVRTRGRDRSASRFVLPANADEAEMEAKRQELTDALNAATEEAYRLVDGAQ